jgi:hypothetical protein
MTRANCPECRAKLEPPFEACGACPWKAAPHRPAPRKREPFVSYSELPEDARRRIDGLRANIRQTLAKACSRSKDAIPHVLTALGGNANSADPTRAEIEDREAEKRRQLAAIRAEEQRERDAIQSEPSA